MRAMERRRSLADDLVGTATLAVAVAGGVLGALASGATAARTIAGGVVQAASGRAGAAPVDPYGPCVVHHHYCCEWVPPRPGCRCC